MFEVACSTPEGPEGQLQDFTHDTRLYAFYTSLRSIQDFTHVFNIYAD